MPCALSGVRTEHWLGREPRAEDSVMIYPPQLTVLVWRQSQKTPALATDALGTR